MPGARRAVAGQALPYRVDLDYGIL